MKLIIVVLLGLTAAAYGSQILTNGDFETGSLSPWTGTWTITNVNCSAGSFCATTTGDNGLEQSFSGIPTQDITSITFDLLHSSTVAPASTVRLFYDDATNDGFGVFTTGTGWNSFDVTSQLRANGTLIAFEVFGNSEVTTMADNVSIVATTPEPRPWALLLIGLAGLVILRRNRRSSPVTRW